MPDQGGTHIGAIATIKQSQRYECGECVKMYCYPDEAAAEY